MKKIVFLSMALLSVVLVGCSNTGANAPEPQSQYTFSGDWYCTRMTGEMAVKVTLPDFGAPLFPGMSGIDTTVTIDTTFAEPIRWTLTNDHYILVEKDTLSGYRYDQLDGKLYISLLRMYEQWGLRSEWLTAIGMTDTVSVAFNYTETQARAVVDEQKNGLIMNVVPYDFKIKSTMNFDRKK